MNAIPSASEQVVLRFFEAAAVPELWPDALHQLAQACGAEGAAAHASNGPKTLGTVASPGVAELHDEFVKRWKAPELNSHRTRGIALIRRGWRGALTEQQCFEPDELAKDPFQQEFFRRFGFSSFAGLILGRGPGVTLSVSIIRRIRQGEYSKGELVYINHLSHHLRAASALALRLGIESSRRLTDAYAMSGNPVALLGRDGSIMHMSRRFEELVGNGIEVKSGQLHSLQPEADRALAAAVAQAVGYDGALQRPFVPVVLPRQHGLRPVVAHVVPVVGRAQDLLQLVCAIVTLTDLESARSGPLPDVLQRAFNLTPAEARLAAQVMTGKTLPEISRVAGVTHETLRTRLKIIFEKTGTGRQTELVSLLSKIPNYSQ